MYKDLKGELITVGSDAHSRNRVGENISLVYDLLKHIGFKYVSTYNSREINGIAL
jgi:histidinol-phosphatase (PHP family)